MLFFLEDVDIIDGEGDTAFGVGALCRRESEYDMQVTVSTRHGNVSDTTREQIESKIQKLKRYYERLSAAEVTIDLEPRSNPQVDIRITAEPKKEFVVQVQEGDLTASFDAALRKLEQQLKKFKEKLTDKRPD
ncbi:MAG: ribosome-associated translation inhibitor RaiA [Planctomycetia bacterium]|nr:ribosome-associated translation inhibitor RaiA [Planctomycetia bacterium]